MGSYKRDFALLFLEIGLAAVVGIFVNTPLGIIIGVLFTIIGIVLLLVDIKKNKARNTLTDNDKEYMSRLNKELQDIGDYYKDLAGTINISKVSQAKIKKLDGRTAVYLGFKIPTLSKPPKKWEIFKMFFWLLCYNQFKLWYLLIKFQVSHSYLLRIFLDLGSIPDDVGIGLSSYDTKGEQLTKRLLRVVGERISSNETITVILRCKDACYAMNNLYLGLLMYPKAHKKSSINFNKLIRQLYELREKMMAYAFADVNKAVIKEFLGD